MFEKLTTPEEIFSFKLGSALSMEKDVLEMLGDLGQAARRQELKEMFAQQADATEQQITALQAVFVSLGEEVQEQPSPTTKGLAKEGSAAIKKTDPSIVDAVVLAGALEATHYQIAVYEVLTTNAEARGAGEAARLLHGILAQEEAAKDAIKAFAKRISTEGIAV